MYWLICKGLMIMKYEFMLKEFVEGKAQR